MAGPPQCEVIADLEHTAQHQWRGQPAGGEEGAGWLAAPLVLCGVLKIGYDLALWWACHEHPLQGE